MAENTQTFASLGKVQAIELLFEGTPYKAFEEPCYYLSSDKKAASTTASRLFTEGVDFDLVYFPLKHLGYKCLVQTVGELYAVMAHPQTLAVSFGVSAKLDFEQIKELWGGVVSAAKEHGFKSVSLDLQPSRNGLIISMSATGETSALTCARRPKAKSMDLICVSGPLGAAYMGQQILEREKLHFNTGAINQETIEHNKMLVASYLKPELSPRTLAQLEDDTLYPSHGYFVTKGLSEAILRLSRDSQLGAKIYADKIPFEGNTFDVGREMDIDPVSAAMNGGDDCRLLFTIPILQAEKFRHDFQTFDIIGHLAQPEVGAVLVTPEGVELPLTSQGW